MDQDIDKVLTDEVTMALSSVHKTIIVLTIEISFTPVGRLLTMTLSSV